MSFAQHKSRISIRKPFSSVSKKKKSSMNVLQQVYSCYGTENCVHMKLTKFY